MKLRTFIIPALGMFALGTVAIACAKKDDAVTTPATDTTTANETAATDTTGATDPGTTADPGTVADPGVTADPGTVTDKGTVTTTLYERLGKNAGITTFIDALVAAEVKDPDIATYFALNGKPEAGHPSVAQIKACLVAQVGNATGGPETYPAKIGDWTCRTMKDAHKGTMISAATFDKFITVAGTLAAGSGLGAADIQTLAGFLVGTKADIVDKDAKDGPFVATLYERLGKNAGITAFVDALVAEEVKDVDIASYFALNGKPEAGHPTVGQIKACLVAQVGNAAGGPELYPAKIGDWTCRTMKDAHKGTMISSGTFDKFLTIAATLATASKLHPNDIGILAGFLTGQKADIVDKDAKDGPFVATLYERLGKNEGITKFVDLLVAEEVKDVDIASYFVKNGTPDAGHPSVAQIKACLVAQVGNAAGGPELYPAKIGDWTCRTMKDAHVGTKISGGTFDKFLTIAATLATAAKMYPGDIGILAGFLTGQKADIVDPAAKDGPFVP